MKVSGGAYKPVSRKKEGPAPRGQTIELALASTLHALDKPDDGLCVAISSDR